MFRIHGQQRSQPRRSGLVWLCIGLGMLATVWTARLGAERPPVNSAPAHHDEVAAALERGLDWLLSQQSPTGDWRSVTYSPARPGTGTGALVLETLARSPAISTDSGQRAYRRAVQAMANQIETQGWPQAADGSSDYPIYQAALLLISLRNVPLEGTAELEQRLITGLIRAQRTEVSGWPADSLERGGWGPGEEFSYPTRTTANVSVTSCVLEALSRTGALTDDVRDAAAAFLKRCQHGPGNPASAQTDWGGFYFTPDPDSPLNKAGVEIPEGGMPQPIAYFGPTCDGVRALSYLGLPHTDERIQGALSALSRMPGPLWIEVDRLPDQTPPQTAGTAFYEVAAFARLLPRLHSASFAEQRERLIRNLLQQQRENGSWSNPVAWMHEDDPLIATSFAISALCELSREVQGESKATGP